MSHQQLLGLYNVKYNLLLPAMVVYKDCMADHGIAEACNSHRNQPDPTGQTGEQVKGEQVLHLFQQVSR